MFLIMKAIFYDITHTKVPSLVDDLHIKYNRGFAYEISTHYVHFYANSTGWYGIHSNLCVVEPKNGTLEDWVIKYFGAQNITIMDNEVGESVEGVWRPGLYYSTNTYQALNTTEVERKLYEQSLRILIEKLDNIFLYIEPDSTSF